MELEVLFLISLPVIAFLYASVGHGGASGYLALMALLSFSPELMKPTALLLNLFVAGISFFHFAKSGHFKWQLFMIFAMTSVPLSFVGGMLSIDPHWYKLILGILLLFAIARMIGLFGKESHSLEKPNLALALLVGAVIGFFSGLIGIGGGIILSPVILLLRWGTVKEAAAVSALFIWVNSAAGMGGQLASGIEFPTNVWLYILLALGGGFLGGYVGSKKWNSQLLKYVLAGVLVMASAKLILT